MKDQIRSNQRNSGFSHFGGWVSVIDLGPDQAFVGRELHRRYASLPFGDGVVAITAAAKNLGLKKLDFALGK
ncbi:hypothetical protein QYF36_007778 [Acer negundo]|nr:hypothetical protein QYF36_007778 [Acer negundo]